MARFAYKAKKGPNETMEGVLEADSEAAAARKLMQSGYYPILLSDELRDKTRAKGCRIKSKDLADFTRRLSELLSSGLTLYNALAVIEENTGGDLRIITANVKSGVKDGKNFSGALKAYPHIFSELYVNLAHAGEESGSLGHVLSNISDLLDKDEDMRSRVREALAYPFLMAAVGAVTIFIMITFIVPRLAGMFIEMGEKLPLCTRILLWAGDFMKHYWILIGLLITAGALVFKNNRSNPIIKDSMDRIVLKLPVFGKIIEDTEFARFSRTLCMLLRNGVPALDALNITSGVITNSSIRKDAGYLCNDIKAGLRLDYAIRKRFPLFVARMVAAGEEGGFLDNALLNIALSYEKELGSLVKIITALLEPAFILIIGLVVGFIVVAMLLPVLQISLAAH